jgi:hypothetical protein
MLTRSTLEERWVPVSDSNKWWECVTGHEGKELP